MFGRIRKMIIAVVLLMLVLLVAVAMQVDDWGRDLTTNRAATSRDSEDPSLRSLELPASGDEVREAISRFVERSGAWKISDSEDASDGSGTVVVRLVRRSRLFRFADDVTVFLQPTDTGTHVDVASQSRVGKGDFGQNPRNIRTLLQALRAEISPSKVGG